MIHRMITPCGKGGIAINIGSKLPHQEINGDLDYDLKQRCQVWLETLRMPALRFHRLNSINEHEGDAVRDPRSDARYRW